MKRPILAVLLASALMPLTLPGEILPPPPMQLPQMTTHVLFAAPPGGNSPQPTQTSKFDLNFPGGGPEALVAAIEKAMGKPLNAIIPSDCKEVQIPPLKMSGVTVEELFSALQSASIKTVIYNTSGRNQWSQRETYYGFKTSGSGDNSVWYFKADKVPQMPPPAEVCHFYQLEGLLQQYKIEDITTAIQTGWEMLHVAKVPQLKFHPETKLLIAVGSDEDLGIIDTVLQQLRSGSMLRPAATPAAAPLP